MSKEYNLPQELLQSNAEKIRDDILDYIERNESVTIILNFTDVQVIISESILLLKRMIKTLTLLGIEVKLRNISGNLALPLSQMLEGLKISQFVEKTSLDKSKINSNLLNIKRETDLKKFEHLFNRNDENKSKILDILTMNKKSNQVGDLTRKPQNKASREILSSIMEVKESKEVSDIDE